MSGTEPNRNFQGRRKAGDGDRSIGLTCGIRVAVGRPDPFRDARSDPTRQAVGSEAGPWDRPSSIDPVITADIGHCSSPLHPHILLSRRRCPCYCYSASHRGGGDSILFSNCRYQSVGAITDGRTPMTVRRPRSPHSQSLGSG